MITMSQVNQYALNNNLGDDTDIFSILSQMQLEYKEVMAKKPIQNIPSASKTEYSIQDVLDLFNS